MDIGLVAGFGHPLGVERLAAIRQHGFTLIRQDVQTVMGRTPDVPGVMGEDGLWAAVGGRFLYIVDHKTIHEVPDGSWIEYLNEPEYIPPLAYAGDLTALRPVIDAKRLVLWAGGIGNLDRDSLQWLSEVVKTAPWVLDISVHRYCPDPGQTPSKAHRGFQTRADEVAALRQIIGARPFLVSEVGYHTAWRRKFIFWKTRLSTRDQATRLTMELDFWAAQPGCVAVCVYQENDGPGEHSADKYGLRTEAGAWKTTTNYNRG